MCSHNKEHNLQFCPRTTSIFSQLQPEAIYKIIIVMQTPVPYTDLSLSWGQENMLFPWRHNITSRNYTVLHNNSNKFPKHIFLSSFTISTPQLFRVCCTLWNRKIGNHTAHEILSRQVAVSMAPPLHITDHYTLQSWWMRPITGQ